MRTLVAVGLALLVAWQVSPVRAQGATVGLDVAEAVGIQQPGEAIRTQGDAAVADYDGDGDLDMMLNRHLEGSDLYRYDAGAGRFVEVQADRFNRPPPGKTASDRHECAWADFNGDGRQDVYCAFGANKGTGESAKELWLQQPDGTFVDRGVAWGVEQPTQRGRDVAVLDADNDGRPDLFTGSDPKRPDGRESDNHLFLNTGDRLRAAPGYGIDLPVGGAAVSTGDFNGRGGGDIVTCPDPRYRPSRCHVYRNQFGQGLRSFADLSDQIPGFPAALDRVEDVELADVDADGRAELIVVQATVMRIYRHETATGFRQVYELALESGRDLAVGRVTDDEFPEIYVVQSGGGQDFILANRGQGAADQRPFTLERHNTPEAGAGSGESVTALEGFREGRAAFVVNNGLQQEAGPRQFIVFPDGF